MIVAVLAVPSLPVLLRKTEKSPKYEWADVEATAAVTIQSVVRYVQTRDSLKHDGFTTAHMRNRIRERKATNNAAWRRVITDDVPGMFRCCGVGLLL